MLKLFNSISHILMDHDTPYVRFAETEYNFEFKMLARSLGRRPSDEEARLLVLNCR